MDHRVKIWSAFPQGLHAGLITERTRGMSDDRPTVVCPSHHRPLAETCLHSRLNGWIATQLFTILPVSHSPPYLSRPIHRGWNASIPIPSFILSGPSCYEIFPVQKDIHAEKSYTSFLSEISFIYRGLKEDRRSFCHQWRSMRDTDPSLCECSGFQKTSKGRGVHNCIKGVFKRLNQ